MTSGGLVYQRAAGLARQPVVEPSASSSPRSSSASSSAGVSAAESAIELWMECKPKGYRAAEERVAGMIPRISARFLHGASAATPQAAADLMQLFLKVEASKPSLFLQLMRPQGGKVHFLYFWKALGEVVRMAEASPCDGLLSELETLRDQVLRRIEEGLRAGGAGRGNAGIIGGGGRGWAQSAQLRGIPGAALLEELDRAAGMSVRPCFWQTALRSLPPDFASQWLSMSELTCLMLSWLHEALMWEHQTAGPLEPSPLNTAPLKDGGGYPILLNIYDVSQEESIQKINSFLAHEYSPLKLGGVFHAGVEVNGLEWSFGHTTSSTRCGVSCIVPRSNPQHHYRQTVACRAMTKSLQEMADILAVLLEEYPGPDYDLLRRNCCHFADDFCQRLGAGPIPAWVHRLARLGAHMDTLVRSVETLQERVCGAPQASQRRRRRATAFLACGALSSSRTGATSKSMDNSEMDLIDMGIWGSGGLRLWRSPWWPGISRSDPQPPKPPTSRYEE